MWLFSSSVLLVQSCPTLQAMDCSPPGSSVHGIFWQEYWSGLLFPSPGDLPDPGMEVGFPALRQILYRLSYLGSPKCDFSSDVTAKENYMEVPQKITELPNKTLTSKRYLHTNVIAALFIRARSWNQPKYPSINKWIKKMWYIHTMQY